MDTDYRITLPKAWLSRLMGLNDAEPAPGSIWLVVLDPESCRVVSEAQAEGNATIARLRAAIQAERDIVETDPLNFSDEPGLTLPLRLLQTEVTKHGRGWRLKFPKPLATVMGVLPSKNAVSLVFLRNQFEIWTLNKIRASFTSRLSELV